MTKRPSSYREELEQKKSASMGQLLFKAARLYNERAIADVRRLSGAERLTVAHTGIFPHLDLEGTRLTTLAQRMGVTKQFAGQLLAELEEQEIIERVPDPEDGRAKLVRFTAKGKRALLHGLDVLGEIESIVVGKIGPKRAKELVATLTDVISALSPSDRE
jgi:DNA-binding MarR family transcriptional regulator